MRRSILSVLVILSAAVPDALRAQDRNAVYAEVFGNALLGSINYERVLLEGFTARVGVGVVPGVFDIGPKLQGPVMLSYVAGDGPHRVEVGGGAVLNYHLPYDDPERPSVRVEHGWERAEATAIVAYRWQPPGRGGFYRLGFTPWLRRDEVVPLFGLSAGVTF